MSSSKSRRKVTVESTTKSSSESSAEKRKPSVFARLGPGAPRRSYEESEPLEKCRNWMKTGECVYGSKCRYQHSSRRDSRECSPSSHRRSRKRKGGDRDRDLEPSAEEDLCEIEDVDKERRERKNRSKKEKESKVKSAIVVTKANLANSENADSDQPQEPEKEELDDFDATLKLMEKRQLIQKQLSMLEAEEVNKDPIEGSTITKSVASDVLDREPVTVPTGSWSGRWDQPKKTSTTLSNEDSPSKRKKKKKRTKGPRTPSPDEERREKRLAEKEAALQPEVLPSRKKAKHSTVDPLQKSRSSGAVSRSPSKSSSGSRSPPRRTHSAGYRRKVDDRSVARGKYESVTASSAKVAPYLEKPKSGRKRQVSSPEVVVESIPARTEKRHRRFLETPREEHVTKAKRTPPPRNDTSRERAVPQQRHHVGETVSSHFVHSSKSRMVAASSPTPAKTHYYQQSRRKKTPPQQPRKSRKRYIEEDDDDESSSDDDDDSSSSGSSSSSSSDSSSSSSSDDSGDSEEEELVKPKSRRHVKSKKTYPVMPDTRVIKKKRSTTTKERYSPVEDSRRSKQRPRGGATERRSKVRRPSPPLLPPLEERQRHWNREHRAPSIDEGRSRSHKRGARSRRPVSPQPVDAIPRSRQKSPSSPYDHQRERQSGRDEFDRHYPEKSRDRAEKWEPVDRRTDSPISRSRGENRDRYPLRPSEFERRPSPPPAELPRRPHSPQDYGKPPKSGRSLSPGDRMVRQYKDDRGRPIRERERLPRDDSPSRLPVPHQSVDRYGKRYGALYDDRESYRPPLLPTPKDRYRYEQEPGSHPPPLPPQLSPPEMLDRYGHEPYLLQLPPGGRDLVMDRRNDALGRRDFPGYHDDGRGARGRNSPDCHPFPPRGYPVDRMLEPPLDPMYPDLKERDRSMLGRSRDRSPLLEKRGEKYRRDELPQRGGDLPPGKGRPSRRQQWEDRPNSRDQQRGLEPPDSRDMSLKKRMPEVEGRGSPGRRRNDMSPVESRHSGAGGRGMDWDRRREDWDRGRDRGGRRRRGKRDQEEDWEPGPSVEGREKWAPPGERVEGEEGARERDWERNKMPKPVEEGPPSRGQSPENRDLREGSTTSSRRRHRSTSKEPLPSGERKKKRAKLEVEAEWEKGDKSRRSRHGSPLPRGAAHPGTSGGAEDDRDDWSEGEKPLDSITQSQKDKKEVPAGEIPGPRPTEEQVRRSPSRSSLGSRHSHPSHDRPHGNDRPHGDCDSDVDGGRGRDRGGRGRPQDWEHDPHPDGPPMGSERGHRGHSRDERGREDRERDREGGHWQRGRHRERHDVRDKPDSPLCDTEMPPGGEIADKSVDVVTPQLAPSGSATKPNDSVSTPIGDIGYESISSGEDIDDIIGDMKDDEQDEHAGRKSGVVDALCIDWSSLVQQQPIRAAPQPSSALKRFQPASVFSRLGVSKAFAGPALLEKVKRLCESQLETSVDAKDITVKEENGTPDKVETASVETITTENLGVEGETKVDASKRVKQSFELLHDVAAFHASAVVKNRERTNLLWAVGPNRRALCARRDLEIRRQLCKLGKDSEGLGMFSLSQGVDQDLYRLSLQLFRQARAGGATATGTKLKPIVDDIKMVAA